MPENIRDIKRRSKSITNTRQITRAMQLVATSKMKRAQKKSEDANPFASGAWDILKNVTARLTEKHFHPFWEKNDSKKIALILVTSDLHDGQIMCLQIVGRAGNKPTLPD